MPTELDFLTAIHAAPEDVTTRAVFADWLEDHGDPRADLVRAIVETQEWLDPDLAALGEIACPAVPERLLRGWLPGIETVGRVEVDPLGLLRLVVTTDRARDNVAWREPGWGWITEAVFTGAHFQPAANLLSRLPVYPRRVVWANGDLEPAPANTRVTTIDQRLRNIDEAPLLRKLTASPCDRLDTLLVGWESCGWYHFDHTFQGPPHLRRLRWGVFVGGYIAEAERRRYIAAFLARPWFRRLAALALELVPHLAELPDLLADSPIQDLRVLSLSRGTTPLPSLDRLTRTPYFPNLRALCLSRLDTAPADLEATLDRLTGGQPRTLHLAAHPGSNSLTGATGALTRSSALAGLRSLHLTGWAEPSLAASLTSVSLPHLRDLDLSGLQLGDDLALRLASWPGLANLHRLNLASNGITDIGMTALARPGLLTHLRYLDLRDNPVTPAGVSVLRAALNPDRLWSLEV
jgi:uncharacterized protein (TIGR02996 family)